MGGARAYVALATAGALAVGAVTVAWAQQSEGLGGKTVTLTVGQTLRYSDNIDLNANGDSALQSRSTLDFSFDSITRTQSLRFDAGGAYEIDTDGETDIDRPYLRLNYTRNAANSRFDLSGSYRRVDFDDTVSTFVIPLDPDTGTPLAPVAETAQIEDGVRTDAFYRLRYETGLRSNVGFTLELSERARRYSQTTSPDLFDSTTRRAAATASFRIDPTITARLSAATTRYDAEDGDTTDREETSFGIGATIDVSPTLRFDGDLRHLDVERDSATGLRVTDGLSYDLALIQDVKNGAITVDFASRPTLNGRRSTLRANRGMELRRGGTLSYGLGVTKTEGLSSEPLFQVAYNQPLKRGRFGVEFVQEARTGELDDDAVILSRLSANYAAPLTRTITLSMGLALADIDARDADGEDRRQVNLRGNLVGQINDVSSWSAGVTLSDTETTDIGGTDSQRRYGVELGYRRQLTRDWNMVARYSHISIDDTAAADRSSNTVSLGVERSFSFRP